MSTFTNSITNIVNSGYTNNYTSKQASQLSEIIKSGAIDSVNFSEESKNLFQISEIDSMFDGIFGIPKDLTKDQQQELESIQKALDLIYPSSSSRLELINYDDIYKKLNLNTEDKTDIEGLTTQLTNYITELSINQLFTNSNTDNLSLYSNNYSSILANKLTDQESQKLADLSLQLNRLFFNNDDNQLSSYLNLFNDIYGLNNPTEEELLNASSLLTERNSLLSNTLLNRSYLSSYGN